MVEAGDMSESEADAAREAVYEAIDAGQTVGEIMEETFDMTIAGDRAALQESFENIMQCIQEWDGAE